MSTIVGNNKRSPGRSTFLLQVRYNAADAKLALQQYLTENPLLAKTPLTKKQVKEIFFKNPLKYFSKKSVDALADFFFNKALDNEYIAELPKIWQDEEQVYAINPEILEMKTGPKKKHKE